MVDEPGPADHGQHGDGDVSHDLGHRHAGLTGEHSLDHTEKYVADEQHHAERRHRRISAVLADELLRRHMRKRGLGKKSPNEMAGGIKNATDQRPDNRVRHVLHRADGRVPKLILQPSQPRDVYRLNPVADRAHRRTPRPTPGTRAARWNGRAHACVAVLPCAVTRVRGYRAGRHAGRSVSDGALRQRAE